MHAEKAAPSAFPALRSSVVGLFLDLFFYCLPMGLGDWAAILEAVRYQADPWRRRSKPLALRRCSKNQFNIEVPMVGDVSDIKLIRTDTTL